MNEIARIKEKQVMNVMPKKYSKFQKLLNLSSDVFHKESLIEVVINDKLLKGKCFINTEKRAMYWRPQHQWYVYFDELETCYSYDLLQDSKCRVIPTDLVLNKYYDKKLKEIMSRGKFHLEETKKAYIELQELGYEV